MEKRVANTKAYMLLSLCISPNDAITFNAIQNAVTQELPSIDAKQAWTDICEINQPATRADQHDLEQQFNHCVLQDDCQNPDRLFSKLENWRISLRLDHQLIITDDSMITQILYNTNSKHYDAMVTVLKLEMTRNASNLTLLDFKKAYRTVFASLKQLNSNTRDRRHELDLNAQANPGRTYKKVFKWDCRTCGQKGHKSADCWEIPQNKDRRPANYKSKKSPEAAYAITVNSGLNCDYCHKRGHTEDRCFKKKREIASPEKTSETTLCVYESILIARAKEDGVFNEYTFIVDTGASRHMVYSQKYLTDWVLMMHQSQQDMKT
jgi:hypothetical protein